ncbi:MAG TPA: DoxX family protein [Solirubrobacteraceae bacterium]|jgi:putative oxidoreductase|nr:DoxX family protein [Solirubrobacteraceae bacterium]
MKLGLAVLRMVIGGLFIGHGLQKLAGWFGGAGMEATGETFEAIGLRPGKIHAGAAGAAEAGGGAMLAAGLFTPLASSLLSGVMITAVRKVHLANGPWVTKSGYEYNLVLLASLFALAELGPGEWSLDEALGTRRAGTAWALGALALGAAGSSAAIAIGTRDAAAETLSPEHARAGEPAPGGQPLSHGQPAHP